MEKINDLTLRIIVNTFCCNKRQMKPICIVARCIDWHDGSSQQAMALAYMFFQKFSRLPLPQVMDFTI
jgi:hypothetical protein